MRLWQIIEAVEKRYPLKYACDWDNTGLQAGDREQQVETAYVALDATDEVIAAAKSANAELLLTHHPLIFQGIKRVTTDSLTGRKIIALLEGGMSCYSVHTNYDVMGLAQLASGRLGLGETFVLEEVLDGEGIGRAGYLPSPMSLEQCAALVKERFGLPSVKIFGDRDAAVNLAALSPGAGKSMFGPAVKARADVLITGDIDHHTGIDLWDMGIAVIDAGHYGIEHIYIEDMRRFLNQACPELRVITAPLKQPFEVV